MTETHVLLIRLAGPVQSWGWPAGSRVATPTPVPPSQV